jgi:hypothetical protein
MDGVSLSNTGKLSVCRIERLSEKLKELIRCELSAICLGRNLTDEDSEYYSYPKTIKKFLETYDNIAPTQQVGIIGELLAHLLISRNYPDFKIVTLLLNKEELQIRKGFDLIYLAESELWYGESKAGELQDNTPTQKAGRLLSNAKNGVKNYLQGTRIKLWDSAILEANQTLSGNDNISAKQLLRNDATQLQTGTDIKKNALLVPVLFNDVSLPIDEAVLLNSVQAIIDEQVFDDVLVFCIHKSTYTKIVDFLRTESAH